MPIVTMTVRRLKTAEFKARVLGAVHGALVDAGVNPNDRFHRVIELDAWASKSLTARSMTREAQLSQIAEGPSPESAFMQGKLGQISREMEGLPDEPTIAQLDVAIKKHLRI
jgi:hypothetical protein